MKDNVLEVSFKDASVRQLEDNMNDLIELSEVMTTSSGRKTIEAAIECIADELRLRASHKVVAV